MPRKWPLSPAPEEPERRQKVTSSWVCGRKELYGAHRKPHKQPHTATAGRSPNRPYPASNKSKSQSGGEGGTATPAELVGLRQTLCSFDTQLPQSGRFRGAIKARKHFNNNLGKDGTSAKTSCSIAGCSYSKVPVGAWHESCPYWTLGHLSFLEGVCRSHVQATTGLRAVSRVPPLGHRFRHSATCRATTVALRRSASLLTATSLSRPVCSAHLWAKQSADVWGVSIRTGSGCNVTAIRARLLSSGGNDPLSCCRHGGHDRFPT